MDTRGADIGWGCGTLIIPHSDERVRDSPDRCMTGSSSICSVDPTLHSAGGHSMSTDAAALSSAGKGSARERLGRSAFVRYVAPIALPVVTAACTAIASVNRGPVRVYWTLGAIAALIGTGFLAVSKERKTRDAQRQAVLAKADLAVALNSAGQPLIAALGDVASARDEPDRLSCIRVLWNVVLDIAQKQCGRQGEAKCDTRSSFYSFEGRSLTLTGTRGRLGEPPRSAFKQGVKEDEGALRLARSDFAKIVLDLDNEPSPVLELGDRKSSKAFIAVPIRAGVGGKSFGLLTVESDQPNTLNRVDLGFMILLAGVLATALAVGEQPWPAGTTNCASPTAGKKDPPSQRVDEGKPEPSRGEE